MPRKNYWRTVKDAKKGCKDKPIGTTSGDQLSQHTEDQDLYTTEEAVEEDKEKALVDKEIQLQRDQMQMKKINQSPVDNTQKHAEEYNNGKMP